MYKFFLYSVLVIIYLGLAKALSPTEHGIQYLQNEKAFSKVIKAKQATAILVDTHTTGFLIKTYYQKYRVVTGFNSVEDLIVRTSKEFARKNLSHIGLSIYRRSDVAEEFLPLPPGSLYLGDREYGDWKKTKTGRVIWKFNKASKNLPRFLGWGKFRPDEDFYQQMRSNITLDQPFFGPNKEFGPEGYVTKKNFPNFFNEERMKKIDMKNLLIEYFKENF